MNSDEVRLRIVSFAPKGASFALNRAQGLRPFDRLSGRLWAAIFRRFAAVTGWARISAEKRGIPSGGDLLESWG